VAFAVDVDVQRSVVALLHADGVVARTGGEDQLVAADVAARVGALAGDPDLAVAVQGVDQDRLAVRGAARRALAAVGGRAVNGNGLLFDGIGPVREAVAAIDIDGSRRGSIAAGGVGPMVVAALGIRRVVPIGRALEVGGGGRVELGGLDAHGALSNRYGCVLFKPRAPPDQAGAYPTSGAPVAIHACRRRLG